MASTQMERSIFLAVTYDGPSPYFGNLLEIPLVKLDPSAPLPIRSVARFVLGSEKKKSTPTLWRLCSLTTKTYSAPQLYECIEWRFCCLSTNNLCLLPDSGPEGYKLEDVPLNGCIFDMRTREVVQKMKPPKAPKLFGHVVSLRDKIYFITDSFWSQDLPSAKLSFERYDPIIDCWETMTPFPYSERMAFKHAMVGYAVLDEFLLFNISGLGLWAYDESSNNWYPVTIHDCCDFLGLAVVVDKTIYALSRLAEGSILALSVTREQKDGGLVFTCSLQLEFSLPVIPYSYPMEYFSKQHLVHVGDDLFCIVRCSECRFNSPCPNDNAHQHLQLILLQIKLLKEEATVTDILEYQVEDLDNVKFCPRFCFSLPSDCVDIVEGQKNVIINPVHEAVKPAPESESKALADTTPGVQKDASVVPKRSASAPGDDAASTMSNTHEEGHSVYVSDLPYLATVEQLEKEFKKFGSVKQDGVQIRRNEVGSTYGFVEFESVTSMEDAIKASSIPIGDCQALIMKKRYPVGGGSS